MGMRIAMERVARTQEGWVRFRFRVDEAETDLPTHPPDHRGFSLTICQRQSVNRWPGEQVNQCSSRASQPMAKSQILKSKEPTPWHDSEMASLFFSPPVQCHPLPLYLPKARTALSIQPWDTPSKRFSQGWKWRGNDSGGVAGLWFWLCGGVGFYALTIEQPLAAFLRLGLTFLFQPTHRPVFSIRDITVSLFIPKSSRESPIYIHYSIDEKRCPTHVPPCCPAKLSSQNLGSPAENPVDCNKSLRYSTPHQQHKHKTNKALHSSE